MPCKVSLPAYHTAPHVVLQLLTRPRKLHNSQHYSCSTGCASVTYACFRPFHEAKVQRPIIFETHYRPIKLETLVQRSLQRSLQPACPEKKGDMGQAT
jgi:hypothetical protein